MIKEGDLVYCDARKQVGIVTRLPRTVTGERKPSDKLFLVLWPDGKETIDHIDTLISTLEVINEAR